MKMMKKRRLTNGMVSDMAGAGYHRVCYVLLQQEYKTEEVVSVVLSLLHPYFLRSHRFFLRVFLFFGKKTYQESIMEINL